MITDNILYQVDSSVSLDDFLEKNPSIIFSEDVEQMSKYTNLDSIIAAFRVYRLVQLWMRDGRPVYPAEDEIRDYECGELVYGYYGYPSSDNISEDMKNVYVCGYGTTDISNLSEKPLLTGHILTLQDWELISDIENVSEMDVYTAFGIVAETVAVQKEDVYDITCMQIPEYEVLRFGVEMRTEDFKKHTACSEYSPYTRCMPHTAIQYELGSGMTTKDFRNRQPETLQLLEISGDRTPAYSGYGFSHYIDILNTCLETSVLVLSNRGQYYESVILSYNRRVQHGENITEGALR